MCWSLIWGLFLFPCVNVLQSLGTFWHYFYLPLPSSLSWFNFLPVPSFSIPAWVFPPTHSLFLGSDGTSLAGFSGNPSHPSLSHYHRQTSSRTPFHNVYQFVSVIYQGIPWLMFITLTRQLTSQEQTPALCFCPFYLQYLSKKSVQKWVNKCTWFINQGCQKF